MKNPFHPTLQPSPTPPQLSHLAVVLLQNHDQRVRELVHFGQVVNPQHAREAVPRLGKRFGRVLRHVAPRRQLVGPPKRAVRLQHGLDDHVEGERKHDGVVHDGKRFDVDGFAVLHQPLAAQDAGHV